MISINVEIWQKKVKNICTEKIAIGWSNWKWSFCGEWLHAWLVRLLCVLSDHVSPVFHTTLHHAPFYCGFHNIEHRVLLKLDVCSAVLVQINVS